jgi:hypothetical protein
VPRGAADGKGKDMSGKEKYLPVGILQPAIDKIVEAERKAEAELEQYYRAENDWWTPDMYSRGIDD